MAYENYYKAKQFYDDVKAIVDKGDGSKIIGEGVHKQFCILTSDSILATANIYGITPKSTYNEVLTGAGLHMSRQSQPTLAGRGSKRNRLPDTIHLSNSFWWFLDNSCPGCDALSMINGIRTMLRYRRRC